MGPAAAAAPVEAAPRAPVAKGAWGAAGVIPGVHQVSLQLWGRGVCQHQCMVVR
jgi:hypothetical protein